MKATLSLLALALGMAAANAQITVGNGSTLSSVPFTGSYPYSYSQTIYPKTSLGNSGNITGLTYKMYSATATFKNTDKVQVWLGHTTKSVFSSASDFVSPSAMTKVFEGTLSFSGGITTINFSTPFSYNNVDNLVVAVNEIAAGSGSSSDKFNATGSSAFTSIQAYSLFGSSPVDPNNISSAFTKTSYNYAPNVTFLGLNPPAVAPTCTTVTSPADGATNVTFLPTVRYSAVGGATKYLVSAGTTPGGTDIDDRYDNGTNLDYYFTEGLDPETTYYITVTPVNSYGEATGCSSSSFTTGKAIANDNCSTAEKVETLPYSKSVDATYASNNAGSVECGGQEVANDGAWYEVTGNGEKLSITVAATSYWDPMIIVKEASCDNPDCALSVNDTGFQGTETGSFQSKAGVKYYVNIGNRSPIDFLEGTFNLNIKSLGTLGTANAADNSNNFSVYPNPVTDKIYIVNAENNAAVEIYTVAGQLIKSVKYSAEGISAGNLQPGVYLLKYSDGKRSQSLKFIKK